MRIVIILLNLTQKIIFVNSVKMVIIKQIIGVQNMRSIC